MAMTNAYSELSNALGMNWATVKCARLEINQGYGIPNTVLILKRNWDHDDLTLFQKELEKVNYDSGFGGQRLFGYVWLSQGWLERGEYDGSEWWVHPTCPNIPDDC